MGQRHQHSHLGTDDSAWLNALVDTFERTEELSNVPCDAKTVSAAISRLQASSVTRASGRQRRRQATLELHH